MSRSLSWPVLCTYISPPPASLPSGLTKATLIQNGGQILDSIQNMGGGTSDVTCFRKMEAIMESVCQSLTNWVGLSLIFNIQSEKPRFHSEWICCLTPFFALTFELLSNISNSNIAVICQTWMNLQIQPFQISPVTKKLTRKKKHTQNSNVSFSPSTHFLTHLVYKWTWT